MSGSRAFGTFCIFLVPIAAVQIWSLTLPELRLPTSLNFSGDSYKDAVANLTSMSQMLSTIALSIIAALGYIEFQRKLGDNEQKSTDSEKSLIAFDFEKALVAFGFIAAILSVYLSAYIGYYTTLIYGIVDGDPRRSLMLPLDYYKFQIYATLIATGVVAAVSFRVFIK